ncbi:hypothetical protein FUA48_08460 [Flavobacterium alkalisoli]|uniref:Uncharacterized protein n=1 Tax=Flavobacterium alkalisoli TaxID=2602769 RepID=A0A5B9FXS4_9FLAO|nr:hypothetical protein [Flavobacterium alkalisoli]QEE49612.1 hypothetical protein FUA48_08460 [Flavobacterium alkalisoli]
MKHLSFAEVIGLLPSIQNGNGVALTPTGKKVKRKTYFVAGISGSSDFTSDGKLIDAGTKKEIGRTNFDKGNMLNEGRSFIVTGVRVLFDTTADVNILTATYKSEAPAPYKNGELKIAQDGSGDFFNNPISAYTKNDYSFEKDVDFMPVVPFQIRPNIPFDIQILTAGLAAAGTAVKVELDGYEFADASNA